MKLKKTLAAALTFVTLGSTVLAGTAGANGTNPGTAGTGFDDKPDMIVGGGSDTTYPVMQLFERVYNQAGGCRTITSSSNPAKGQCLTGASQDQSDYAGNWDHDVAVSSYPTGSSAGVAGMLGQDGNNPALYDYARSSRGPKTSGETGSVFWGFAKDAVAFVTFGNRAAADLTVQEIRDIYSCQKTDWSQIGGGAFGSGPIEPIGMNPDSGTKATMDAFLGVDANGGSCVKKLANGVFPFENDVKQLDDTAINKDNAIWWMSIAAWKAYSYKRVDAKVNTVAGRSPQNQLHVATNQYPATRFLFHVTRSADAAASGTTDEVVGAVNGKGGAVREFTEFICKNSARHTLNEYSGDSNSVELGRATAESGFYQIPASERTNGACRVVNAP